MSRLHKGSIREGEKIEKDFYDKTLNHFILGLASDAEYIPQEERTRLLDFLKTAEIIDSQKAAAFCQNTAKLIGSDLHITVGVQRLICRNAPIEGDLQSVVPEIVRQWVLYARHYPGTAENLNTKRMFDDLKGKFYWPHMAVIIFSKIERSASCRRSSPFNKRQR